MSPTVLIVEDDPGIVVGMVEALQEAGFEVSAAGSGPAALEALSALSVDLVLLDLNLPGPDGFEVCRRMRETSQVPIVMVTARSEAHEVVAGLELGADDYIVKPFEASVLVARRQRRIAKVRRRRAAHAGGA